MTSRTMDLHQEGHPAALANLGAEVGVIAFLLPYPTLHHTFPLYSSSLLSFLFPFHPFLSAPDPAGKAYNVPPSLSLD